MVRLDVLPEEAGHAFLDSASIGEQPPNRSRVVLRAFRRNAQRVHPSESVGRTGMAVIRRGVALEDFADVGVECRGVAWIAPLGSALRSVFRDSATKVVSREELRVRASEFWKNKGTVPIFQ